jgi:hypothetical protein
MNKHKKLYFSRNIKLLYSIYLIVIIGISAYFSLKIIDNYTGRFIYQQPNISNYILKSLRCDKIDRDFLQNPFIFNYSNSEEYVLLQNQKYSVEKPNNTFRIIALGDSVTFGLGVDRNESYPAVLERMLNANTSGNLKFEVLNFGVRGFTMYQKVELFKKKALIYKPDLIIIQWWDDDIWNATELKLIFKDLLVNICQNDNYTQLFSTNEATEI